MNTSKLLKLTATSVMTSFLSLSCLFVADVAHSRPTASQVEAWLKSGVLALGIGGAGYKGYKTYTKDGEVKRVYKYENGDQFSYTANCRDNKNVARFWRHSNNGNAVAVIRKQFPDNRSQQSDAVLELIKWTCNP